MLLGYALGCAQGVRKAKTAIKSSHCPETSLPCAKGSVCVCSWGSNRFYIQWLLKERVKKLLLQIYWCEDFFTFSPPGKLCGCLQSLQELLWIYIRKGGREHQKNENFSLLLLGFFIFSPWEGPGRFIQEHTTPRWPYLLKSWNHFQGGWKEWQREAAE